MRGGAPQTGRARRDARVRGKKRRRNRRCGIVARRRPASPAPLAAATASPPWGRDVPHPRLAVPPFPSPRDSVSLLALSTAPRRPRCVSPHESRHDTSAPVVGAPRGRRSGRSRATRRERSRELPRGASRGHARGGRRSDGARREEGASDGRVRDGDLGSKRPAAARTGGTGSFARFARRRPGEAGGGSPQGARGSRRGEGGGGREEAERAESLGARCRARARGGGVAPPRLSGLGARGEGEGGEAASRRAALGRPGGRASRRFRPLCASRWPP